MITQKEAVVLFFVERYIREHTISPTFEEIRRGIGLASKSQVHRFISSLERNGRIRKLASRARAIEIIGSASTPFNAEVLPFSRPTKSVVVTVPLDIDGTMNVPRWLLGERGPHEAWSIAEDGHGQGLHAGDVIVNSGGHLVGMIRKYEKPAGG